MSKFGLSILAIAMVFSLVATFAIGVPAINAAGPTVMAAQDPKLGNILVDNKGMTLYLYTKDEPGKSNCAGGCATAWPPLTVPAGTTPTATAGITGTLTTLQRADGTTQVAYDGSPLYYWKNDKNPGDTTGQNVGDVWFVINVAEPTIKAMQDPKLGNILVDNKGMTLYLYKTDEPGKSNCSGACATNWPPLTVPAGTMPTAADGVAGMLTTLQRADGTTQVAYNGSPLYFWKADKNPGDTTGQGVKDVWFVVNVAEPTIKATQDPKLGNILVDSKGMTLYLYKKDEPGKSNCTGGCATAWPPLTVPAGTTPTAAAGLTGALTTLQRADGTTQVAYDDWPLYFWKNDKNPGDTTGQGVGSVWFIIPAK